MSANGSSAVGRCTLAGTRNGRARCATAESSVLLDGNVPTLTRVPTDDAWAREFLVFDTSNPVHMEFSFSMIHTIIGVEVILFNCKDWGVEVQYIQILTESHSELRTLATFGTVSCRFLTTFCISIPGTDLNAIGLQFIPGPAYKIILAEVRFLVSGSFCDPTTTTLDPTATTEPTDAPSNSTCTLLLLIFSLLVVCLIAIIVFLALWQCYEVHKKDQLTPLKEEYDYP